MTNSSTLKLKYTNGIVPSEPIDEMKCIPEVSESDIEVIRKQFGQSRYGEVMLGRFRDYDYNQSPNSKALVSASRNSPNAVAVTATQSYGNEVSSETETGSQNGNSDPDKAASYKANAEETLVILKTLDKEKLRNEFVHEMKSKWFISAKSQRVAKLIGYLSTPRHMAMVLECGNCDLSHFLPNCDKKLIGLVFLWID